MKNIFFIQLFCFTLLFTAYGIDLSDPLVIEPTVINFDSIPEITKQTKIFIGSITDHTASQSTGIIGKTRTGIKTTAPIIIKPSLSESVHKSLELILQKKGNISTDASTATFVLDLVITDCTLIEKSAFLSQTMDAFLKIDVKLTDPLSADKVHSFTVKSENSTKAVDTSKYAEAVLKEAIGNAIAEIFRTINTY